MKFSWVCVIAVSLLAAGCAKAPAATTESPPSARAEAVPSESELSPVWRNATVYFLLTDRFANGDPANDGAYGRQRDGDLLRSFEGGDIAGVIEKLEAGYFKDLGVTAIWTTPLIEQVHQPFEEYGRSYAFHGYWPRDWTAVDNAYGTEAEFARMVELAHEQGIRVVVDVIMNHAGPPIGGVDPAWPEDWVRTEPRCDYESYAGIAPCLIVPALQDMRTESTTPVELPDFLVQKWKAEGRYEQETAELDAFFARTGYPRTPRYYIIKWSTDWVREYGVDGFRIDTAKHVDPEAWAELKAEADTAFAEWKTEHPAKTLDDEAFYMVGEIFNWGVAGFQKAVPGDRSFDYGDMQVDFFDHGFDALINMGFATHADMAMPELFQLYADELNGPLAGKGVLNYLASHDDMGPYDPDRLSPYENALKLLLAPGGVQIYYGDETSRDLTIEEAIGDATLRAPMNWKALETEDGAALFDHWRKLAQFRADHPAIGAGRHVEHSREPFVFSRVLAAREDAVLVAIADKGRVLGPIATHNVFPDGAQVRDAYSQVICEAADGVLPCFEDHRLVLLERVVGPD